jgi:hypothetical protein
MQANDNKWDHCCLSMATLSIYMYNICRSTVLQECTVVAKCILITGTGYSVGIWLWLCIEPVTHDHLSVTSHVQWPSLLVRLSRNFHRCTVHVASVISLIFQLMHTHNIYTLKSTKMYIKILKNLSLFYVFRSHF